MKKSSGKSKLQKFAKQALTKNQQRKLKGGDGSGDGNDDGIITTDIIIE